MEKILIADDEPDVISVVSLIFALVADGVGVISARSGHDAVEKARERPDLTLALLDVQMPPGNDGGFWAAGELKVLRPQLPIFFLSAITAPDRIGRAERLGVHGYIAKEQMIDRDLPRILLCRDWEALIEKARRTRGIWVFAPLLEEMPE